MKRVSDVNLCVGSYLAAIDMGSNSFHLLIAQVTPDGWRQEYAAEQKVQLAAGSDDGYLKEEAQARALACLRDYQNIIAQYSLTELQVVATASLRGVMNAEPFLIAVERLLGVRPNTISGPREAELVYLGVSSGLSSGSEAAMTPASIVVDIGGGSTELALGSGSELVHGLSVDVGCLRFLRYFPEGKLCRAHFSAAYKAALAMFTQALSDFPASFLDPSPRVIGCSGTLLAVEQVLLVQQKIADGELTGIHITPLRALADNLSLFNTVDEVCYQGLSEDRRSIFASGVVIVLALFEALGIASMDISARGLREGIIESRCVTSRLRFQQGGQQQ